MESLKKVHTALFAEVTDLVKNKGSFTESSAIDLQTLENLLAIQIIMLGLDIPTLDTSPEELDAKLTSFKDDIHRHVAAYKAIKEKEPFLDQADLDYYSSVFKDYLIETTIQRQNFADYRTFTELPVPLRHQLINSLSDGIFETQERNITQAIARIELLKSQNFDARKTAAPHLRILKKQIKELLSESREFSEQNEVKTAIRVRDEKRARDQKKADEVVANIIASRVIPEPGFFSRHWKAITATTSSWAALGAGAGTAVGLLSGLPTLGLGALFTPVLAGIGFVLGGAIGFAVGCAGCAIADKKESAHLKAKADLKIRKERNTTPMIMYFLKHAHISKQQFSDLENQIIKTAPSDKRSKTLKAMTRLHKLVVNGDNPYFKTNKFNKDKFNDDVHRFLKYQQKLPPKTDIIIDLDSDEESVIDSKPKGQAPGSNNA
jgi:hypothetical protein